MPLKSRLHIAAIVTLLTGLTSSAGIYLVTDEPPGADVLDEFINSKRYNHDLAVYGGKLMVLADDFRRWFASLWHGRQLAFTVAGITVVVSLCLYLVARSISNEPPGANNGNIPGS